MASAVASSIPLRLGFVSLAGDPRLDWSLLHTGRDSQGPRNTTLLPPSCSLDLSRRCKASDASRGKEDPAASIELVKSSPKGKTWEESK